MTNTPETPTPTTRAPISTRRQAGETAGLGFASVLVMAWVRSQWPDADPTIHDAVLAGLLVLGTTALSICRNALVVASERNPTLARILGLSLVLLAVLPLSGCATGAGAFGQSQRDEVLVEGQCDVEFVEGYVATVRPAKGGGSCKVHTKTSTGGPISQQGAGVFESAFMLGAKAAANAVAPGAGAVVPAPAPRAPPPTPGTVPPAPPDPAE